MFCANCSRLSMFCLSNVSSSSFAFSSMKDLNSGIPERSMRT